MKIKIKIKIINIKIKIVINQCFINQPTLCLFPLLVVRFRNFSRNTSVLFSSSCQTPLPYPTIYLNF